MNLEKFCDLVSLRSGIPKANLVQAVLAVRDALEYLIEHGYDDTYEYINLGIGKFYVKKLEPHPYKNVTTGKYTVTRPSWIVRISPARRLRILMRKRSLCSAENRKG